MSEQNESNWNWHRSLLEGRAALFAGLTTVAITIGGLVELIPMFTVQVDQAQTTEVEVYTALEQAGRDIYVSEGCYNCHSQMIRPFRAETLRYGDWTRAEEYTWDRPFQLGSRRIGPDLQRVGKKYAGSGGAYWHWEHMKDPRDTSPGSIMPPYPWLYEKRIDPDEVKASLVALAKLGHPYSDADIANVEQDLKTQGEAIVALLEEKGVTEAEPDLEVIALISYLQRLGLDGPSDLADASGSNQ